MRWTPALVILAAFAACDLNEGPREETREAVEAAREGRPPSAVREQVEDVSAARPVDRVALERDLERDLRKTENWSERIRRDLASGARAADEEFQRTFNDIEHELLEVRQEFDALGKKSDAERQQVTEALRERVRQLKLRVDALDGEVDDRPGPDPQGPG